MIGKTLEELLPELKFKMLTLNIMNGKSLILSHTIMWNRVEENFEERYVTISDGNANMVFIDKEELKKYKLVRIENNNIHYVFHYEVNK
jgi:hypothetical protein